jgi:hypothetical protein
MKYFFLFIFLTMPFIPHEISRYKGPAVLIKRDVKQVGAGEYEIDLTIYKDSVNSMGALTELFANGRPFTASAIKTGGASFAVREEGVKFIWVSMPPDKVIHLSYLLKGIKLPAADFQGFLKYVYKNELYTTEIKSRDVTYKEN